jgi:alkanesulfonate monooxygenase SsuD/methylene tetrahydromethanopterin reductase-like flavin-dependent oxidoreductase (luciferase family)
LSDNLLTYNTSVNDDSVALGSRPMTLRIGLDLYPMQTSWPPMREIAVLADRVGFDSLWTWDHLYGTDDPEHSIYEGWTTVAAWAALTSNATVGLLVGANTFRNPGLVAKSAVTVDHISGGRCVLGLGAGWRPGEHLDHGIELGRGPGQRLGWLEESVAIIKGLLAGETVSSPPGGHYAVRGASHRPPPIRGPGRIPILVGGGGERRTLRIVARYADMWHHRGSLEVLLRKRDVLRAHCAEVGRDVAAIELTFGPYVVVRNDPAEARRVLEAALAHNDERYDGDPNGAWLGPPDEIAARWRPFVDEGWRHLIASIASPYDRETVERLIEVRALLGD